MSVAEAENAESIRDLEYMKLALHQAELALHAEEIPVGCVITLEGKVIATGYNKTNETRNGTKHAEMVAIETLLLGSAGSNGTGFDSSQFRRCSLYVTCEPCIMCAAALSKLGFREVIFGCDNDRFGGNGSILSIHTIGSKNSHSSSSDVVGDSSSSSSSSGSGSKQVNNTDGSSHHDHSSLSTQLTHSSAHSLAQYSSSQYHAYPVRRGVMKDEAIAIFQQFYLSENRRAPESKRKRKALRTLPSQRPANAVCAVANVSGTDSSPCFTASDPIEK